MSSPPPALPPKSPTHLTHPQGPTYPPRSGHQAAPHDRERRVSRGAGQHHAVAAPAAEKGMVMVYPTSLDAVVSEASQNRQQGHQHEARTSTGIHQPLHHPHHSHHPLHSAVHHPHDPQQPYHTANPPSQPDTATSPIDSDEQFPRSPIFARLKRTLVSRDSLSRTWEKASFAEECRSAPASVTGNAQEETMEEIELPRRGRQGAPQSRPSSLYASPSALRAFRPLSPHSAPSTPMPRLHEAAQAHSYAPVAVHDSPGH